MSKIMAYVQPIFAPDKIRLDRNLDSLHSMSVHLQCHPFDDIEFYFGGWAKDEYWPLISEVVTREFAGRKFILKKFDKNYGKGKVVNTLMKDVDTKYVLTADSDILFLKEEYKMFERLINAAEISPVIRGIPFGMLSLNQSGNNCHLSFCYNQRVEYDNKFGRYEAHCFPDGGGGIAGGCIFFENKLWKLIGGYKVMGVYAGDDAYFLMDVYNLKRSIQIFETCSVIHPHEDDPVYAQWKVRICQRDSNPFRTLTEEQMQEAKIFWDTHK